MRLIISDETLRDGEQQVGVNFSVREKYHLAKKLAEAGVDQIVVMPIVSQQEERLARRLLSSKFSDRVYAATMLGEGFVDHSVKLGFKKVILFASLSDRLIRIKGKSRQQSLEEAVRVCRYCKQLGLEVFFAGEDASRADREYLVDFISAIRSFINVFIVCDTVGVLTPYKTRELIRFLKASVHCDLGAHFHNDRGLADDNSKEAVDAGAVLVSGTTGGIGERAGNADLYKVLTGLDGHRVDFVKLKCARASVYKLGGSRPARPYSARAFWHESGIHVRALLHDPLSYNSFLPEKYNRKNRIFFGKFSGIANFKHLFGDAYPDDELGKMRDMIKILSYRNKKSYSEREVKGLMKNLISRSARR